MLGLSCGMWDLDPWPGIEPRSPTLGTQSLSHWTTGKSPFIHCWWTVWLPPCLGYLKTVLLLTLGCMYLFELQFVFSGYMPRSGTAGSYGSFIFKEPPYCSPQWLHQFTFPPTVTGWFPFLHNLSRIYYLCTFWWWPFWPTWGDTLL